jgi:hypothetical protein
MENDRYLVYKINKNVVCTINGIEFLNTLNKALSDRPDLFKYTTYHDPSYDITYKDIILN